MSETFCTFPGCTIDGRHHHTGSHAGDAVVLYHNGPCDEKDAQIADLKQKLAEAEKAARFMADWLYSEASDDLYYSEELEEAVDRWRTKP